MSFSRLKLVANQDALCVHAKIPGAYAPVVVEAPSSLSERVFDLTAAFERGRAEQKLLYIYYGANDCPPCHEYTRFLEGNVEQLRPHFQKVIVVDIRTWLRGPAVFFVVGDKRYTFKEFQRLLGDSAKFDFWPYRWLVAPNGKLAKTIPQGREARDTYLSVERHIEAITLAPAR
jgi:thiol-disulfide isomerase/thioredoxin